MDRWLGQLSDELARRESENLRRHLVAVEPVPGGRLVKCNGRELVNFAGNDYLALATHPHLKQAAIEAIETFGTGSTASRLVSGHQLIHEQVERRFAEFKRAEAALIFPTGYMANLAVLTTLVKDGDLVCLDKLNHASLIDAARACDGEMRVYAHGQFAKLERLLDAHLNSENSNSKSQNRFIVTDSVFSMDGDTADLSAICDLADRYDAIIIVDEAHATGVLGARGSGLCELLDVHERVDVVVSTASKALGGLGGIVTARREVIDTLINGARSFIYTTGVPPAQVAVIAAALDVIAKEPWRRHRAIELAGRLRDQLGMDEGLTPIVPIACGSAENALEMAGRLEKAGFFAPAIRPPTVAPGSARVRLSVGAEIEDDDVNRLCQVLQGA